MNEFRLNSDRVRLAADIWLHRHGPWWLLLAVLILLLLALALLVIPGRQAELARQQAMLGDLQARASQPLPVAAATSTSADNYHRFRATLADEEQVIYEAPAREFINVAAALLEVDAAAVKDRLHALGYDRIPGKADERVKAYRALKAPLAVADPAAHDALFDDAPDAVQAALETLRGQMD